MVKNPSATQETLVRSLGQEDPLEKGMQPSPVLLAGEFHGQRSLVPLFEKFKPPNQLVVGEGRGILYFSLKLGEKNVKTLAYNRSQMLSRSELP